MYEDIIENIIYSWESSSLLNSDEYLQLRVHQNRGEDFSGFKFKLQRLYLTSVSHVESVIDRWLYRDLHR